MKKSELEDYVKVIAKEVIRIGQLSDSHTNALSTIMQAMSQNNKNIKLFEPLDKKFIKSFKEYKEAECK